MLVSGQELNSHSLKRSVSDHNKNRMGKKYLIPTFTSFRKAALYEEAVSFLSPLTLMQGFRIV